MRNAGLGSWPERRLRISPQKPAIWFEGTTTSHAGFADRVRRTAGALDALGVRRGNRVAWTGGNHPSVPWQDAAISVATHKANVYIDLSGWSPKYFPPQLVKAANGLLKHKVLFGSDYPLLRPERWIADFEELEIKDEVRPLIMKENAIRALGLR